LEGVSSLNETRDSISGVIDIPEIIKNIGQ
jgi:hypothetical protein